MEETGKEKNHPSSEGISASDKLSKSSEMNEEAKQMARTKKASAIRKACAAHDIEALAAHAASEGGLLEDGLRQMACELLSSKEDELN